MKLLKLGTNFTYQRLLNNDFVVYSANGTAKPFVLAEQAKIVFEELLRIHPISKETFISNLKQRDLTEKAVKAILEYLGTEGVLAKQVVEIPAGSPKKQSKHLTFWMHVTNNCNLRCPYCYIYKNPGKISISTINTFLGFLVKEAVKGRLESVTLKFAGGEPTLAFPLIKYTVSKAKEALHPYRITPRFTMITNGTVLTEEICAFLGQEAFTVSVSLDGLGEFNNARLYPNGRKSAQDTLNGIELLQKHGISPHILSVVSNTNVLGIHSLIEYMVSKELGVNLILCRALDDSGNLLLDLDLMRQELIPVLKKIVRAEEEKLPKLTFSTTGLNGKRKRACSGGENYFVLGDDGKISTCPMAVVKTQNKSLTLENDIEEVRRAFVPKERPPACTECVWKYACAGGCDVMAKNYAGSTSTPFCSIMKLILEELLFLEGRRIQISKRR